MKLKSPAARTTPSDDNLIPMINVVFLLLIFFMVAGTIRHSDPMAINAPLTLSGSEQQAQPVLYLDAGGAMVLNETPVRADELAEALTTSIAMSPTKQSEDDGSRSSAVSSTEREDLPALAIKADAQTPVALLRQVLEDARIAGIHTVELVTQQTSTRP